jgi:hypothetical protein
MLVVVSNDGRKSKLEALSFFRIEFPIDNISLGALFFCEINMSFLIGMASKYVVSKGKAGKRSLHTYPMPYHGCKYLCGKSALLKYWPVVY